MYGISTFIMDDLENSIEDTRDKLEIKRHASLQERASKMIPFEKRDKATSDFIASISRWRAVRLSSEPAIRHVSRHSEEFRIEF